MLMHTKWKPKKLSWSTPTDVKVGSGSIMLSKLLACAKNEMPGVIMLPSQEVTPDRVVDEVRRMTKMAASEFGIRPDLPTYADLNFHYVRGAEKLL